MPIPMSRFILPLNARVIRTCAALVTGWALSACFLLPNEDCLSIGSYGVMVRVVDASTRKPIAPIAIVTITEAAYTEILRESGSKPDDPVYMGANERVGMYDLRVEAPGYVTATRNGLVVRRGGHCNYLQPAEVVVGLVATTP